MAFWSIKISWFRINEKALKMDAIYMVD